MANYFREAVNERTAIVNRIVADIGRADFQTIVCRGVSGMYISPIVAHLLGKELAVIRKPGEDCHHFSNAVGRVIGKWIIIDDFIEKGGTVQAIVDAVAAMNAYTGGNYHGTAYRTPNAKCVGFYGYCDSIKVEGNAKYKIAKWQEVLDPLNIPILNPEAIRYGHRGQSPEYSVLA